MKIAALLARRLAPTLGPESTTKRGFCHVSAVTIWQVMWPHSFFLLFQSTAIYQTLPTLFYALEDQQQTKQPQIFSLGKLTF